MASTCCKLPVILSSCSGQECLSGRHLAVETSVLIQGLKADRLLDNVVDNFDEVTTDDMTDSCNEYVITASGRTQRPADDACPDGYSIIEDEAACEVANQCLAYRWQGTVDSTITNENRQYGCIWMRRGGGTVWFNPNVDGKVHKRVQRLCRQDAVPSPVPSTVPATTPVPSTVPATTPVPSTVPATTPVPSTCIPFSGPVDIDGDDCFFWTGPRLGLAGCEQPIPFIQSGLDSAAITTYDDDDFTKGNCCYCPKP